MRAVLCVKHGFDTRIMCGNQRGKLGPEGHFSKTGQHDWSARLVSKIGQQDWSARPVRRTGTR